jgi:hypothetical protein
VIEWVEQFIVTNVRSYLAPLGMRSCAEDTWKCTYRAGSQTPHHNGAIAWHGGD